MCKGHTKSLSTTRLKNSVDSIPNMVLVLSGKESVLASSGSIISTVSHSTLSYLNLSNAAHDEPGVGSTDCSQAAMSAPSGVRQQDMTLNEQQDHRTGIPIFPWHQLHDMLNDANRLGFRDLISWDDGGRSFKVHDKALFAAKVMPEYFHGQRQYKSFQRQLNMYGFKMLTWGPHKGAYTHDLLERGNPDVCRFMIRCKVQRGRQGKGDRHDKRTMARVHSAEIFKAMLKTKSSRALEDRRSVSCPNTFERVSSIERMYQARSTQNETFGHEMVSYSRGEIASPPTHMLGSSSDAFGRSAKCGTEEFAPKASHFVPGLLLEEDPRNDAASRSHFIAHDDDENSCFMSAAEQSCEHGNDFGMLWDLEPSPIPGGKGEPRPLSTFQSSSISGSWLPLVSAEEGVELLRTLLLP